MGGTEEIRIGATINLLTLTIESLLLPVLQHLVLRIQDPRQAY